jgi:formylglycine-generating enzyme required for sulfatase activity
MLTPRAFRPSSTAAAALLAAAATAPLAAQARSTVLIGPPALGAVCYVRHVLPTGSAGHIAGFLWSNPFPGAVPVTGVTTIGLLRVDPASVIMLGVAITDGVNLPTLSVGPPTSAALIGSRLDCQSFDVDPTWTYHLAANDVAVTIVAGPSAALDMVAIAPGTYLRGSPITPLNVAPYNNQAESQPVQQVAISRPFWIGRHEVTQAQYQAVMGNNPSWHQGGAYPGAAQRPVELVSWNNAVAYCAALTTTERAAGRVPAGYVYRLPTEAEWEYCCRAGTTTEFHTGPALLCNQANFRYSNHSNSNCPTPGGSQTAVVGSHAANGFGLRDMHGNVAEWCLDGWDLAANHPAGAAVDPYVASGPYRIVRGGNWNAVSNVCRSANRVGSVPTGTASTRGFRVVLAPIVP